MCVNNKTEILMVLSGFDYYHRIERQLFFMTTVSFFAAHTVFLEVTVRDLGVGDVDCSLLLPRR